MTIRVYDDLPDQPLRQPSYLTIGNFDGVHLGHQALIEDMTAQAHAAGCLAGLLTFDPHPLAVLRPQAPLAHLTSVGERIELLGAHGLDFVVTLKFTRELAATGAEDFLRKLVERLQLEALWIGPDFALGRGREGTAERLPLIGAMLGFAVHVTNLVDTLGEPVRSSRVRALLGEQGDVASASALLGRPYQIWGSIQRGAGRGHDLGYPTANLAVPGHRLVPAFGIYACWAWLGDRHDEGHPAAVSIGVRPTFGPGERSIEAYLLDYGGDLYGQNMGLSFIERLRGEQRFPTAQALMEQMARDSDATRRILGDPPDDAMEQGSGSVEEPAQASSTVSGGLGSTASPSPAQSVASEPIWEELPHTADQAVRVQAATSGQLYARAAHAMYALQGADFARPITLARAVTVIAQDPADLLVGWLNRLLSCQEIHGEMYTRFRITDVGPQGLIGVAFGYRGFPERAGIKAATYWNLMVQTGAGRCTATVTFDV
jgi:riboflavin kinase/FMN adenylyltransferase